VECSERVACEAPIQPGRKFWCPTRTSAARPDWQGIRLPHLLATGRVPAPAQHTRFGLSVLQPSPVSQNRHPTIFSTGLPDLSMKLLQIAENSTRLLR